jgi:hypothetical protein
MAALTAMLAMLSIQRNAFRLPSFGVGVVEAARDGELRNAGLGGDQKRRGGRRRIRPS